MNSVVSRTLSLIPDRVPRVQSGSIFDPRASVSPHPERIAHLAQFLSWLGPLNPITRDDLRILGFGAAVFGKPALGTEEGEGERDLSAADDEPAPAVEAPVEASVEDQPLPPQPHPEATTLG